MITLNSTPKQTGEPDSIRVKGHRIHTGGSDVLSHVDIYQYADGSVRAVAARRREHPTIDGCGYVVTEFTGDYMNTVNLHVANETRLGFFTGDHPLPL